MEQDNSQIRSELVFQQTLITKLQKLGIRCASEFRIPARKGEEFRVDLMITFPIRAIIEIKNFRNKATTDKSLKPLIDTFNAINKRYFGTLRFFLIDLSGRKNLPLDPTKDGIHFIKIPERERDSASYCAKEIKNCIFQQELKLNQADSTHLMPSNLDPAYFDLFKINVSEFEEVLISLGAYIKPEEYKMVVEEVSELNSEIISKHYTSAALRIGRTLEYVIYTLAIAWDVKINRVTSELVKDLDQSNTQLKKLIIDYLYSTEEEKIKKKNSLSKKSQQMASKIINLAFEIDNLDEPKETNIPINLQTIMRDIKQKFSHIEKARTILDSIIGGPPIKVLLEMRNTAAHAKVLNDQKEINEENISEMIDHLKSIIFDLVNLAVLIKEAGRGNL